MLDKAKNDDIRYYEIKQLSQTNKRFRAAISRDRHSQHPLLQDNQQHQPPTALL